MAWRMASKEIGICLRAMYQSSLFGPAWPLVHEDLRAIEFEYTSPPTATLNPYRFPIFRGCSVIQMQAA